MISPFFAKRYFGGGTLAPDVRAASWISVIGVALGVGALVVALAILKGFDAKYRANLLGFNSHIALIGPGEISPGQFPEDKISAQEDILATAPFIYREAILAGKGGTSGVVVKGIDPVRSGKVTEVENSLVATLDGNLDLPHSFGKAVGGKPRRVILGTQLASKLGITWDDETHTLDPGQKVRLLAFHDVRWFSFKGGEREVESGDSQPPGFRPRIEVLEVGGIFHAGMYEFDSRFVYLSIPVAQDLFRIQGKITGIEIRVSDIFKARAIAHRLEDDLGYPFLAKSWEEMNANLFSALKLERVVIIIVFSLIVLVSSFNIIGTLVMMILERKRDVSILKALGATKGFIIRIFLLNGAILGLLGGAVGLGLGCLITFTIGHWNIIPLDPEVYFISQIPVDFSWADAGLIVGIAFVIALLASSIPAFQAARVYPSEGLRYE